MKKILILVAVFGMSLTDSAQAMLRFNLLAGANFADQAIDPEIPGVSTSSESAFAYGVTAEFDMGALLSFDVGALSVGYKTDKRALQIPALIRFTALPLLDFGGGLYYALPEDQGSDIGFRLSARLKIPLTPITDLVLDGNYDHGLSDLDSSARSVKHRSYGLLTGISLGF